MRVHNSFSSFFLLFMYRVVYFPLAFSCRHSVRNFSILNANVTRPVTYRLLMMINVIVFSLFSSLCFIIIMFFVLHSWGGAIIYLSFVGFSGCESTDWHLIGPVGIMCWKMYSTVSEQVIVYENVMQEWCLRLIWCIRATKSRDVNSWQGFCLHCLLVDKDLALLAP